MNLQAICNSKLKFIDIFCGWPGSCHDSRIRTNSPIYQKLRSGFLLKDYHLLGDTAYPLDIFIMVSYKDNGQLRKSHKKFNLASSSRVVIENVFDRLKGVFRWLQYLNLNKLKFFKYIMAAACILHNFWIRQTVKYDLSEIDLGPMTELEDNSAQTVTPNPDAEARRNALRLQLKHVLYTVIYCIVNHYLEQNFKYYVFFSSFY